jgi:hypothetical protein
MRRRTIHIILKKKDIYIVWVIILILINVIGTQLFAGTLSCTVATSCPSGTVIWRLSSTTNAHSELPSQSNPNYTQLVCCSGVTGMGNSCSGAYGVVAKISSTTNAHVQRNDFLGYNENICLQAPSGATVDVAYQNTNCLGYDTTVASLSSSTNAHVGNASAYTTKICATMEEPNLTFAVDSGSQSLNVTPTIVAATTSILTVKTTYGNGFTISAQKQNSDYTLKLNTNAAVVINDKTEWIAPAATTTVGNSTASSTQPLTLQFRVKANGTDLPNFASTWWGADDLESNALFGGFPSTTQRIVDRSTAAPATTTTTVLYNLNVSAEQPSGTYSGDIIYTAVANL